MKILPLVCAACLLLVSTAYAAEENHWQPCIELKDKAPAERELDCYRQAAASEAKETDISKPLLSARAKGLEQEWASSDATLVTHRMNYVLLYAKSSNTNESPTSPNPQNQVTTPLPQDLRNMKFQLSVKHDVADLDRLGSVWAGFTLLSFWQVYDSAHSRPFRENNYEPELIYSIKPDKLLGESRFNPSLVNIGVVHQSNGQANPRSRSWNRVYVQTGFEKDYAEDRKLIALVRGWQRISESIGGDDNPDITNYLGYGDIELRYSQGRNWEATLLLKARSVQLDLAAPWTAYRLLALAAPGEHNTNIHLHYFNGYGESLIDYNHKHETLGFGVSFPFE
ncbi:MAG: phospholipase A [Sideroxydans sp.]|jgi:phospholipase A1